MKLRSRIVSIIIQKKTLFHEGLDRVYILMSYNTLYIMKLDNKQRIVKVVMLITD